MVRPSEAPLRRLRTVVAVLAAATGLALVLALVPPAAAGPDGGGAHQESVRASPSALAGPARSIPPLLGLAAVLATIFGCAAPRVQSRVGATVGVPAARHVARALGPRGPPVLPAR